MFIKEKDNLLVHVVPKEYMGKEEMLTYIATQANYNMTGQQLLELTTGMWQLNNNEKNYKLVEVKANGEKDICPNQTLRESGIAHNAVIQIQEA